MLLLLPMLDGWVDRHRGLSLSIWHPLLWFVVVAYVGRLSGPSPWFVLINLASIVVICCCCLCWTVEWTVTVVCPYQSGIHCCDLLLLLMLDGWVDRHRGLSLSIWHPLLWFVVVAYVGRLSGPSPWFVLINLASIVVICCCCLCWTVEWTVTVVCPCQFGIHCCDLTLCFEHWQCVNIWTYISWHKFVILIW